MHLRGKERHYDMDPSNLKAIHNSFGIQAQGFENTSMSFSKKEYLDYTVSRIEPVSTDSVLEVAAGTCALGRSLAPFVKTMTCLDVTPAMLEVGKREALDSHLENMIFVKGCAEELPFLDNSFDIVVSRLAFHHFPDIHRPFQEMVRVLKPAGKLVLIDMEAAEETLRVTEDELETLRDPSHVKNLSKEEILKLFTGNSLTVEKCEKTEIPVSLKAWLELTKASEPVKEKIIAFIASEIDGHMKTGFSPYLKEKMFFFNQRWILVIGQKSLLLNSKSDK